MSAYPITIPITASTLDYWRGDMQASWETQGGQDDADHPYIWTERRKTRLVINNRAEHDALIADAEYRRPQHWDDRLGYREAMARVYDRLVEALTDTRQQHEYATVGDLRVQVLERYAAKVDCRVCGGDGWVEPGPDGESTCFPCGGSGKAGTARFAKVGMLEGPDRGRIREVRASSLGPDRDGSGRTRGDIEAEGMADARGRAARDREVIAREPTESNGNLAVADGDGLVQLADGSVTTAMRHARRLIELHDARAQCDRQTLAMYARGRYTTRVAGRSASVTDRVERLRDAGYITVDGEPRTGAVSVTQAGREAVEGWALQVS